jgi:thiol-disulfide isomerase/thioredoxin
MKLIMLCTIAILSACSPVFTQTINQSALDAAGNKMLIGRSTTSALKEPPFGDWFNKGYEEYILKTDSINLLKPLLSNKKVMIFLGTWCGDSRREVPKMLKILGAAGLPENNVDLIMVSNHDDAYKLSPQHEEAGKNILRVPTFIFYENGKEIGRIVESPVVTLENDMIQVLSKQSYTPNYKAGTWLMSRVDKESLAKLEGEETSIVTTIKPISRHRSELSSIGYVLLAEKKIKEALFVFNLNTKLYPEDVSVYSALAEGYWKAGDKTKAQELLTKALTMKPDHAYSLELKKKIGE